MNTIKCQILLKAVELGSITRAAEDMGYTQSAVSRSIADLEREWDVTLLTRNKDGVVRPCATPSEHWRAKSPPSTASPAARCG